MRRKYELTPTPIYTGLDRLCAVVDHAMKDALQATIAEVVQAVVNVASAIGYTYGDDDTEQLIQDVSALRKQLDEVFEGKRVPWYWNLGSLRAVAEQAGRMADAAAVGNPTSIGELRVIANELGSLFEKPADPPPPDIALRRRTFSREEVTLVNVEGEDSHEL